MLNVKIAANKLIRQVLQQFRIRRRIASANVIQRLNKTCTSHVAPQTIHKAGREVRIVLRGNPSGQLGSTRCTFWRGVVAVVRKLGSDVLFGSNVLHFTIGFVKHLFVKRLSTFDSGSTNLAIGAIGSIFFQSSLREVGGHLVVLILRPSFEWMVMAFVAVESHR